MSLAVVRDLRVTRPPVTADEVAAFETDVLAGFVLARAAAGLSDGTIASDVMHLEQMRAWFGRPLWEMQPADADVYFGKVLRDAAKGTRLSRAQAVKTYFLFLELRHKVEIHQMTGHVVSVSTSSTANPNTTLWCNYTMPARTNTNQFADFPQLGSDSRYFYLTMVDLAGGSQTDSVLAVVPKTEAESCKTVHWSRWSQLRDPGTACTLCTQDNLAFHVSPATVSDSLDGNGWPADAYSGGGSHITVWYLDSSNLLHAQQVSTPSYSVSTAAAQPGTTAVLDPDQPQFTGITKTGGELYLALSSGYDWGNGNKNAVVNWMQINATAGSIGLDKAGSFGAAGLWYLYPSSSGSAAAGEYQTFTSAVTGSVPVGNSIASIDYTGAVTSNTYAPIGVSTYSGAPAGAEEGCYVSNCYRWGDFTSMVIDPVDPGNTMWAAGMFAAAETSWATHITQITNS